MLDSSPQTCRLREALPFSAAPRSPLCSWQARWTGSSCCGGCLPPAVRLQREGGGHVHSMSTCERMNETSKQEQQGDLLVPGSKGISNPGLHSSPPQLSSPCLGAKWGGEVPEHTFFSSEGRVLARLSCFWLFTAELLLCSGPCDSHWYPCESPGHPGS